MLAPAILYCAFCVYAARRHLAFLPAIRSAHVLTLTLVALSAADDENWSLAAFLILGAIFCLFHDDARPRPQELNEIDV